MLHVQVNFPVAERLHLLVQSNKFVMSVKIKAAGNLKLNDSPAVYTCTLNLLLQKEHTVYTCPIYL